MSLVMITLYIHKCFKWHTIVKFLTIVYKTPLKLQVVTKSNSKPISDSILSSRDNIQTLQNVHLMVNWERVKFYNSKSSFQTKGKGNDSHLEFTREDEWKNFQCQKKICLKQQDLCTVFGNLLCFQVYSVSSPCLSLKTLPKGHI